MVSQRSGERAVDYFGTFVAEFLGMVPYAVLAGGACLLLGDRVEVTMGQVALGVLVTYVLSVPLQLEVKYLVHGTRPKPPYTVASQITGDLFGRGLAGTVGMGLVVQPVGWGVGIGALAAVVVTILILLWHRPWEPDLSDEELQARAAKFREQLKRGQ